MSSSAGDPLDARLNALAARIGEALERASTWIEPLRLVDRSAPAPDPALRSEIEHATASARLQAQRCAALEDRIAELEAALVGARDQRARAEALADSARQQANAALDELERLRSGQPHASALDSGLGEALQAKLLEIERLTRERDALRTSCDELRGRNRELRRERDESSLTLERQSSQLDELRERDASTRSKLAEFERIISEQRRELELAERRAKHMRAHLGTNVR